MAEGTVGNSIVKHVFLQRIQAQYKLAIAALDESIPVEQPASVADHIADLLSTQTSTASSVQGVDSDILTELLKGQRKLNFRMDKLAKDVAPLSMREKQNRGRSGSLNYSKERGHKPAILKKVNSCLPPCYYKE